MGKKFYRDYALVTVLLLGLMLGFVLLINHYFITSDTFDDSDMRMIVIDAGHGGEDGGAVSITGISESVYNLQIATCLNDLFNLIGVKTYMLRTTDCDLHIEGTTIAQRKASDLKQRVNTVNQFRNAILISIHQNYFEDYRYSGLQTFYRNDASKALAEQIQASYKSFISPTSRRLSQKKTGVYLLENASCKAVLVECGFLSNREEEARLKTLHYQQKLASVIVHAVMTELAS